MNHTPAGTLPRRSSGRPPQQPTWSDLGTAARVTGLLAQMPPLVRHEDVAALRDLLARVAVGELTTIQFGDCAEDPLADKEAHTAGSLVLERALREAAQARPGDILMVGRIAGQYAKPRSAETELIGGQELLAYRGHMVNRPDADHREHDAWHMMACFAAAQEVMARLGWVAHTGPITCESHPLWTSHEALVLDYETALVRPHRYGTYLASTHWPWIGERTRQPDGQHVRLLAGVTNPVAVKIGPTSTPDDALALAERLDPEGQPGRLTFISRMGRGAVERVLGPIVDAVREAGHPAVWMCDPMHGNTTKLADGTKVRFVDHVVEEVHEFLACTSAHGVFAGGLHLEATAEDVQECHANADDVRPGRRSTLCDPRLNLAQAVRVVGAWNLGLDMSRHPARVAS